MYFDWKVGDSKCFLWIIRWQSPKRGIPTTQTANIGIPKAKAKLKWVDPQHFKVISTWSLDTFLSNEIHLKSVKVVCVIVG